MIDTTLGAYRIESELGSGGMGSVYAARVVGDAPSLPRGAFVALKIIHPHLVELPGVFERFIREGDIGRAVEHPNVVRTYAAETLAGPHGEHHVLVMEFVEGQTVRQLLTELGRVPEKLCRHIGREVSQGLGAIHAAGVVHRDLKPENILITPEHDVKIMDLGVARLKDEAIRLSQSGAFVGSLQCAAPEQLSPRRGEIDQRADLHAIGLLLYELGTNEHPFAHDDVRQVIHAVLNVTPRRLGEINPHLSPFFEEVVHILLAKQPQDRFQSADELADVLEQGEDSSWWRSRSHAQRITVRSPLRRMRLSRETALFGRDVELAQLHRLYERAKSGEGQVVLIEGEAGIGKSRLVDEFVRRLEVEREDLRFQFGSYPPTGAATASGAFSTAFREELGPEGSARYLPGMEPLVPAFDAVLSGESAPAEALALTSESLATCFVRTTQSFANERPVVLFIDDLHFAPDDARALFTTLALAIPDHRVLLIGSLRPGRSIAWVSHLSRLDHGTHMTLSRLGPKDLALLLESSFRSEHLARDLGYQIAVSSDGNPFFAFEIIRMLQEGGFLRERPDGAWEIVREIERIRIPPSVLDLVNARVADLDESERELLDVAACCGYEFDPAILGAAVGLRPIPLLRALARIERKHRLVRSNGARVAFDHQQVQEALHQALPEALRREYHTSIARAIESHEGTDHCEPERVTGCLCADLCDHYFHAHDETRAGRYLDCALDHLAESHLHAEVVALLERAIGTPGLVDGERRLDLLLRQAGSLEVLGRRDDERRTLDAARPLAEALVDEGGTQRPLARVLVAFGSHLYRHSHYPEAQQALVRGDELARRSGDAHAECRAAGALGSVALWRGEYHDAIAHFERALALARALGTRKEESSAIGNLGSALNRLGRHDEARDHYRRSLEIAQECGFPAGEASARCNLAIVYRRLGDFDEARTHFEAALEISRMLGHRRGEIADTGNLGNLLFSLGLYDEARRHHEHCLSLARETGDRRWQGLSLHNLANAWSQLGQLTEAHDLAVQSRAIAENIGDRGGVDYGDWFLGDQAAWTKDLVTAETLLRRATQNFRTAGSVDELSGALVSLAALLARTARVPEARALLAEAIDLAERTGICGPVVLARCRLALLDSAADRGTGSALAAASTLDASGGRLEHHEHLEARYLLWRATGDSAQLSAACELRAQSLAQNPSEYHAAMLSNIPAHRDVVAASTRQGLC